VAQAIGCLVRNALKYGEGRPVEIALSRAPDAALVTVRDSGVGIEPGCIDRIFGRFERASSAQHYAGLGLGLFFARSIVEAHGGTIHVHSAPRAGATFTMRLPFGDYAAAEAPA
jgi:signal transduction histidine kinase